MSISKSLVFIALVSVFTISGFFIGQNSKSNINVEAQSQPMSASNIPNLMKSLKELQITSISVSEDDKGKVLAKVIRKINKSCEEEIFPDSCEKFIIYGENGKAIFEYKDFGIAGTNFARLINSTSSQMILETNGGGTDNFLHIFDRKGEGYSEIVDPSSDFLQIRGGYFTMLQYRTGMEHPYFKPSQLIAIQQIGGGDNDATASIIRFQNGKLQKVGEFSMQKLGDFIEQQIATTR